MIFVGIILQIDVYKLVKLCLGVRIGLNIGSFRQLSDQVL